MRCTLPLHLYAQDAGVEGPLPTAFTFTGNPLFTLVGKVKEIGKLVKKEEEVWGGIVNYYEHAVDFVQVVKLKGNIKTSLAGKVEFMVCNESLCLAPSDVNFSVAIGG
jgi:thiol:disulfide interchange protein DsbD